MSHGPAKDWGVDNALAFKTRVGLVLFVVYGLIYAGFVVINTVKPRLMGIEVAFGLNLACVYGFGLIALAVIMGVLYNWACTRQENARNHGSKGGAQ